MNPVLSGQKEVRHHPLRWSNANGTTQSMRWDPTHPHHEEISPWNGPLRTTWFGRLRTERPCHLVRWALVSSGLPTSNWKFSVLLFPALPALTSYRFDPPFFQPGHRTYAASRQARASLPPRCLRRSRRVVPRCMRHGRFCRRPRWPRRST